MLTSFGWVEADLEAEAGYEHRRRDGDRTWASAPASSPVRSLSTGSWTPYALRNATTVVAVSGYVLNRRVLSPRTSPVNSPTF